MFYLSVSAGWDDFEADVSEGVEDDHGVCSDTDTVTGLGRWSTGAGESLPSSLMLWLFIKRGLFDFFFGKITID